MTGERWQEIKNVLEAALPMSSERRRAYLDQACAADQSLRCEVESLLAADKEAQTSFLQSPPLTVRLEKGTRLGDYEIQSLLGAGGMGEVYRARDLRLRRDVAVKILPAVVSSDPERLRRFEQEATAAAALNHPNILAVHQLGTYAGTTYLVSELLEGETLREQVKRGRIAPRRVIDYGVQIAHGLAMAHEKGIVHRDLKPENLFLTKDGRVKILDFGLARLKGPEPGSAHSVLTIGSVTEPGMVMGTVGYMSPEQVRGETADHRADIFAFGTILYEMLTGKRAFQKPTSPETMTAILNEDPPNPAEVGLNIPRALCVLVERCLEKSSAERFQAARDLAFALEAASSGSTTSPVVSSKPYAKFAIAASLVAVAIIAALALGHRFLHSSIATFPTFHRLTFRPGVVLGARFAPDGRTVVYGGKFDGRSSHLYVTSADSPESRALEADEVSLLSVSDSGRAAVIRSCRQQAMLVDCQGTLATMPLAGGAPRDVMNDVEAADWVPQTDELAVAHRVGAICRVEFPIGNTVYETPGWISALRVSRDATEIAIAEHGTAGSDGGEVVILDRSGHKKAQTEAFESIEGLAWATSRNEVWFVASPPNEGWANEIHFLGVSGREGLLWKLQGMSRLHDIFRDGRMLISREDWRMGLNFRGIHDPPEKERDLSWTDLSEIMDLAADGSEVLFLEAGEAPQVGDLYLRKTDGSPAVRLGDGDWGSRSPDGHWVVASSAEERGELSLIPTGVGNRKAIPPADFIKSYGQPGFLPDGKHIVFAATNGKDWRIYTQDLEGGKPIAVTPGIGQHEPHSFQLASPDGKFVWARDLQDRLTVYPLDGSAPRPVPGLSPDDIPANWGKDSNHVYVYRNDLPAVVYLVDLASGKKVEVTRFYPRDPVGQDGVKAVRVTADGKFGAYSYLRALSELYLVRDFGVRP